MHKCAIQRVPRLVSIQSRSRPSGGCGPKNKSSDEKAALFFNSNRERHAALSGSNSSDAGSPVSNTVIDQNLRAGTGCGRQSLRVFPPSRQSPASSHVIINCNRPFSAERLNMSEELTV